MTHEDLVSIGVKAFGQRHKIIKEVTKNYLKKIINTPLSCNDSLQYVDLPFGCDSCESSFKSVTELNNHFEIHGTVQHDSQYGGGNLYDDITKI